MYLLRHLLPSPDLPAANDGIFFPGSDFDFFVETIGGKQIPVAARFATTTAELASAIFDYNCEQYRSLSYRESWLTDMGSRHPA